MEHCGADVILDCLVVWYWLELELESNWIFFFIIFLFFIISYRDITAQFGQIEYGLAKIKAICQK